MRRFFTWKMNLLLLALLTGCAREVTIDLPDAEQKVVAIGHFQPGQPFEVNVSLSQPVYDNSQPEIPSQAEVTLSVEGKYIDRLYQPDGETYWRSRKALAAAGIPYTLTVRVGGLPLASATSTIPKNSGLHDIELRPEDVKTVALADGRQALRIPIELYPNQLPANAPYFAFNLLSERDVYLPSNEGHPQVLDHTVQEAAYFLADGPTLSLLHDVAEPVVLVDENFWNGNRLALYLDALVPYDPATEKPRRLLIEWRTLSEEFYRYHLSLARQGSGLPLSDPDAVYNNIEGGYGNFSGFSSVIDTLVIPE